MNALEVVLMVFAGLLGWFHPGFALFLIGVILLVALLLHWVGKIVGTESLE